MVLRQNKKIFSAQMTESSLEDPLRKKCIPGVINRAITPWELVGKDVLKIERTQFGDKAFDEEIF